MIYKHVFDAVTSMLVDGGYTGNPINLSCKHSDFVRNRTSIDEHPAIVEERTRIGDREINTVIGQNHQGALATLVDRVSKFTLIKKVDSK